MKVVRKSAIKLDAPIPVYDIVQATPNNNFLVESGNSMIAAHNCGMLDEIEFVKGSSPEMESAAVMKIYRSVKRRMESRFMRQGELPGMLFLVSSKKSEHDFLEQYAASQRDNPYVYIVDEPLWRVKPKSNYSGRTFNVAVGNKFVKSKIIPPNDQVSNYTTQGYRVIEVPVEHRQAFDLDIDSALMDIAGIATSSKSKFLSYDRISNNYTIRKNPFKAEVIITGLDDRIEIKDYFLPDQVLETIRYKPGFVHIDTSLTGDRTGISYVCISGAREVNRYTKTDQVSVEKEIDLELHHVFTILIQSPSDSQISFEKNRQFIYYLKSIGFNIQLVSADGYQSADTLQLMTVAGFNTKLISLDRTPHGYLTLKQVFNENRIDMVNLEGMILETELVELERDGMTGKVDHPPNGSKDAADSLGGAVLGASTYKLSNSIRHSANDSRLVSDLLGEASGSKFGAEADILGLNIINIESDDDQNRYYDSDGIVDW